MLFSGPTSCPRTDCKWLLPSHVTNLTPLIDINFSSAKKQKTFDNRFLISFVVHGLINFSILCSTIFISLLSFCLIIFIISFMVFKAVSNSQSNGIRNRTLYFRLSQLGHKPVVLSLVCHILTVMSQI